MSHNQKKSNQPTKGPSNNRSRSGPDYSGMPSLRGNQFIPLPMDRSMIPLRAPVSLSQGERLRPILPASASWQPSNCLEPGSTSSSNPSMKRHFSLAFEGLDSSSRQSMGRATDPATGFIPDIRRDGRPSASLTSAALQPSSSNLEQPRHNVSSSASSDSSRNLRPRLTSSTTSNPMLFSSAFEGLHPSFRPSVERAMDPTTGLFPNIPMDAIRDFLMQQPQELKFQYRRAALCAEWSSDVIADSETRAKKAEEEVHNLRSKLRACQEQQKSMEKAIDILNTQLRASQASLQEERQSKEQANRFQIQVIEEERKLRWQADMEREASIERIKELEAKLAILEQERQQELEQERDDNEHIFQVTTGLGDDAGELREHRFRNCPSGSVAAVERGQAETGYLSQVVNGLVATFDEPLDHSSGDCPSESAAAGERDLEQGPTEMQYISQFVMGLEATIIEPQDQLSGDLTSEPPAAVEQREQGILGLEPPVEVTTGLEVNEELHGNLDFLEDLLLEPPAMEREQEQWLAC